MTAPPAAAKRLSRHAGTAAALVGLLLVALWAYGWFVTRGGLASDDWALMSEISLPVEGGWWNGVEGLWDRASYRPFSVAYYAVVFEALGTNGSLHLLWSVAVTTAFAGALFSVLRVAGTRTPHAFAIAALVLVAPMGDAAVLWPSATPIRFAGALYLAGLTIALLGMREGRPAGRARALHAAAIGCYVAAIWTYELTAALTAAGLLTYLAVAPWRRALGRWAVDMAVMAAAMTWTLAQTPKQVQDPEQAWAHAKIIVKQLWQLYGDVAAPPGVPGGMAGPVTIGVGVVGVVLLVRARRGGDDRPAAAEARRWAITGLIALVYTMAAYVVFVPADVYYSPEAVNFGNRVNGVGIAPLVLLAYCAAMVLATLAFQGRRIRGVSAAMVAGLVYAVVMLISYNGALRDHERQYVQSSDTALAALDAIEQAVPRPMPGTLVLTSGVPPLVATDLPVFAATWDLQGAVRLRYRDPSLDAFNAYLGFECAADGITVPAGPPGRYGHTVVVDVPGGRAWRIDSARACEAARP